MDHDILIPALSMCRVVCDGSSCGSGDVLPHIHERQDGGKPAGLVTYDKGRRTGFSEDASDENANRSLSLMLEIKVAFCAEQAEKFDRLRGQCIREINRLEQS